MKYFGTKCTTYFSIVNIRSEKSCKEIGNIYNLCDLV